MLNYNQLYYFYMAASLGGITSAAKVLRISQPSLSAQIKTLEGTLNRKLFDRAGRKMKLTQDGEEIYGHCRRIYEAGTALEEALATGASHAPRLQIGVSLQIDRPFLVDIIGGVIHKQPPEKAPVITMRSEDHESLVSKLRSRSLDVIITSQPVFDPDFRTLSEVRMPVVVAYRADGRFKALGRRRNESLRELSQSLNLRWVLPLRGLRLRNEIERFFEKGRIEARPSFESDVMATLIRAVQDDVGVALIPLQYIRAQIEQESIQWMGPPEGFWSHGLWLIARKSESAASVMTDLERSFRKNLSGRPARSRS